MAEEHLGFVVESQSRVGIASSCSDLDKELPLRTSIFIFVN